MIESLLQCRLCCDWWASAMSHWRTPLRVTANKRSSHFVAKWHGIELGRLIRAQ